MDARKRYDQSDTEERISRLAKPRRLHLFLPGVIAIILALHPVFNANTPFSDALKILLNPVAICTIIVMLISGVKLDRESRQLYQALCVPVDNMNIKHILNIIDTRHKTLQVIRAVNAVALLVTFFIVYDRNNTGVQYACLLGVTTNYLGDKKRIIDFLGV